MKKRLLKDLPFGRDGITKRGTVIEFVAGTFYIDLGNTYYEDGSTSSNGYYHFTSAEEDILKRLWNDPNWFEDATLNHVDINIVGNNKIVLEFDSISTEDIESLAKGINHYFTALLGEGTYAWDELAGFTSRIKRKYKVEC